MHHPRDVLVYARGLARGRAQVDVGGHADGRLHSCDPRREFVFFPTDTHLFDAR